MRFVVVAALDARPSRKILDGRVKVPAMTKRFDVI